MIINKFPVPKFLVDDQAIDLNDKLIEKFGIFMFLGVPRILLTPIPATYADAFKIYAARLYVLYHDYGMKFFDEFSGICTYHKEDICDMRTLVCHGCSNMVKAKVFGLLKSRYFTDDANFTEKFSDWDDFSQKAQNDDWKILVEKIVDDADAIYDDIEKKVNNNNAFLKNLQNKFTSNSYVFDRSFDPRFFRTILDDYQSIWYKVKTSVVATASDVEKVCKSLCRGKDIVAGNTVTYISLKQQICRDFQKNVGPTIMTYYNTENVFQMLEDMVVLIIKQILKQIV